MILIRSVHQHGLDGNQYDEKIFLYTKVSYKQMYVVNTTYGMLYGSTGLT